ncbi:MAG TPA: PspC domain-containing protein, partial [Flavobacteriia bacterium]|nr:PspC domain-containing protein [Flavobacteriia bacterium]
MNKTVNINLGGIFFHIDEEAYQKLKSYLDAIRNSLNDDEQGKNEIINDIEIRISELLSEKVKNVRQVVNTNDVDAIIEVMGKPEDYSVEESLFDDDLKINKKRKRLFRDPDDKFLGGVCSGIAHYLGIDPIWVRLFWLFLVVTYGSGVLIYFLLWILLPVANTTSQKLEMEGEDVTISNIEKKIKEEFKDVSNRFKDGVNDFSNEIKKGNYESKLKSALQEIISVASQLFQILFKNIGKIVGVFLILFSGLVLLG